MFLVVSRNTHEHESGNIIYLKNYRKDVIILNAIEDAREMLERRCAFYSDRAKNVMTDL